MIWQDIVITIANIIFSASLLPQIYYGFKKKEGTITLITSGPTFIALYAICFAFFTLSLYFSTIMSFITGSLWLVLFVQRLIYR